jgi:nitrogenase molybdenum-iron protein beta chain
MTGDLVMYPRGGARVEDIADSGNARLTLALGSYASSDAARLLDRKCGVPELVLKTPIGIKATDAFLMALRQNFVRKVPYSLEEERGQLVDIITDTHYHFHGKKVAIFGDPDIVLAMTEFLLSLGMKPVHVLTGTPGGAIGTSVGDFVGDMREMLEASGIEARIKAGGDLFDLHQWIKNEPVDLLMGNTYGKYIARAEDLPFVRIGFPILDRSTHPYLPIVGYRGAMRLVEMISNALLDRADRDAREEDFELVM